MESTIYLENQDFFKIYFSFECNTFLSYHIAVGRIIIFDYQRVLENGSVIIIRHKVYEEILFPMFIVLRLVHIMIVFHLMHLPQQTQPLLQVMPLFYSLLTVWFLDALNTEV